MTQYLLSVIHNAETGPSRVASGEADIEEMFAAVEEFNERLRADDQWVFAGGLQPIAETRTARLAEDGRSAMLVDGPYLDSKEQLGGFWVVDCDETVVDDIARRAAVACQGDVEVRPFQSE